MLLSTVRWCMFSHKFNFSDDIIKQSWISILFLVLSETAVLGKQQHQHGLPYHWTWTLLSMCRMSESQCPMQTCGSPDSQRAFQSSRKSVESNPGGYNFIKCGLHFFKVACTTDGVYVLWGCTSGGVYVLWGCTSGGVYIYDYIIFTCTPDESYRRRLRSFSLYLCYAYWALVNSLAWPSVKVVFQQECFMFHDSCFITTFSPCEGSYRRKIRYACSRKWLSKINKEITCLCCAK